MTHEHHFNQAEPRAGEARTRIVVVLTAVTMVVEIAAGIAYGSMALLADGLHMASHASALGLALVAYVYARRRALDRRFSFGTGKVNALAGFAYGFQTPTICNSDPPWSGRGAEISGAL